MDNRIRGALAILFLCGFATASFANSTGAISWTLRGQSGDSAAGCGACHGGAGTKIANVTISGPASVTPGSTVPYTFTISGISAGSAVAGFGAAITKGLAVQPTFQTGTGLAIGDGSTQATHNPAKTPTAGSACG